MAKVDFSDTGKAKEWLETQTQTVRCAIASRAALRVLANISPLVDQNGPTRALACLKANLTSAVCGTGQTADVERFRADSVVHYAAHSAGSRFHPQKPRCVS